MSVPNYSISKAVLEEIAMDNLYPLPTQFLNSGGFGDCYLTTDPDMVCRFGYMDFDGEKEKIIKKLKNTGGVTKVYHQVTKSIKVKGYKKQVICSWKEKVVTGIKAIDDYFKNKYGSNYYHDIINPFDALVWHSDVYCGKKAAVIEKLQEFTKFPELSAFVKAIKKGLPLGDISLYKNTGLNKNNQIVAFDC